MGHDSSAAKCNIVITVHSTLLKSLVNLLSKCMANFQILYAGEITIFLKLFT